MQTIFGGQCGNQSDKKADDPKEHSSNFVWSTISAIVTAIVVFYATQYVSDKEPHLTKVSTNIVPFKGDQGEVGIFNVFITNNGNKEAEDVEGQIGVEGASIEEVKVNPAILSATKAITNDTVDVKCKLLNPNTSVQISALVKKSSGLPAQPTVEFRGLPHWGGFGLTSVDNLVGWVRTQLHVLGPDPAYELSAPQVAS